MRLRNRSSACSNLARWANRSPHSAEKRYRRCRDHGVADLLPERIKPIAVVPREDRNVRRKRFLVGETLRLVLADENHCARPPQKSPIGLVVMIFVPDDVSP